MIYTVTLNPSIDYIVGTNAFHIGKTNRSSFEKKYPGGKGINVSRILKELKIESTALGFIGGFTGEYINNELVSLGIHTDFIKVEEDSRINIKLKTSNEETELNGQGPHISEKAITQLKDQLKKLTSKDLVILSGSKPPSLSDHFYEELIQIIHEVDADFIIDTNANELLEALKYKPFLIKPNKDELEELFQIEVSSLKEILPYGKKLIELGAKHAIISLGGEGAYLFVGEDVYFGPAPDGKLVNSVGAGDSMLAGFSAAFLEAENVEEAFKMALASGSATAFNEDLAIREDILDLLESVEIYRVQD